MDKVIDDAIEKVLTDIGAADDAETREKLAHVLDSLARTRAVYDNLKK